jgi:hypothetical protein
MYEGFLWLAKGSGGLTHMVSANDEDDAKGWEILGS